MAWNLEIHSLSEGQSKSTLVIAIDPTGGPGGQPMSRTMLVDGGAASDAEKIHTYVAKRLGELGVPLDHILVSSYDKQRVCGVTALLIADNLWHICAEIARPAAQWAALGRNRPERIARGVAAAASVMRGSYCIPGGNDDRGAIAQVQAAMIDTGVPHTATDEQAVALGLSAAKNDPHTINPALINPYYPIRLNAVAKAAGLVAAEMLAARNHSDDEVFEVVLRAIFHGLQSAVPVGSRFPTGGTYAKTHVLDIGNTFQTPIDYQRALSGRFAFSENVRIVIPGVNRLTTSLAHAPLGTEILWNSGPHATLGAENAPSVYLTSLLKYTWPAPEMNPPMAGDHPASDDGIGLLVRLNRFQQTLGGPLPAPMENFLPASTIEAGLPHALQLRAAYKSESETPIFPNDHTDQTTFQEILKATDVRCFQLTS